DRGMQLAQRHPFYELAQPGLLRGAVVAPVAVPFVDHVVQLGVEPAGDLRMASERVHRAVVVPAPVDVARAPLVAPDVAELAVEIRLPRLAVAGLEVPRGAGTRTVAHHLVVALPRPPRQVGVPRVDVGLGVAAAPAG